MLGFFLDKKEKETKNRGVEGFPSLIIVQIFTSFGIIFVQVPFKWLSYHPLYSLFQLIIFVASDRAKNFTKGIQNRKKYVHEEVKGI